MIPILNAKQIRNADRFTILHEPIKSINLMERASEAFVSWFTKKFETTAGHIGIFCGMGNNGGDGLAIARILHQRGYRVSCWYVKRGKASEDFSENLRRLKALTKVREISRVGDFPEMAFDIIIDALFGSGLSRPVKGIHTSLIRAMNKSEATRISVDIPSGLQSTSPSTGEIFKADHTLTFQLPKLSFLLPGAAEPAGDWTAIDIGLSQDFIQRQETPYYFTTSSDVKKILKVRRRFDHKGTFGKALLVSGSFGKVGAAVLASRAAIRSGVGLLTVHTPVCGYHVLQTTTPEAMVTADGNRDIITNIAEPLLFDAVGVGPGIGTDLKTVKAFGKLLDDFRYPMVIDADAINILALNREYISRIPEGSILTPHPGELRRLIGEWKNEFERLDRQIEFAVKTKTVLVAKGAYTCIATPDGKGFFNPTGNPGMATGGSGDALTGLLTGLLAQSYAPEQAAILGIYIHGMAGDIANYYTGNEALTASDIISALPEAFREIR